MAGARKTFNTPGDAHELTFSCYRRIPQFEREPLVSLFLSSLDQARDACKFHLWAFVVMPDHVHLLIWPTEPVYRMDRILTAIKKPASHLCLSWLREHDERALARLRVSEKGGKARHRFWQDGPGYDRNLFASPAVWSSISYMHANPVRKGLVGSELDCPWSSARWYADREDWVLRVDSCPLERPKRIPDYRRDY